MQVPVDDEVQMQTLMPITCLMGQLYAQQRAAQAWLVAQGIDRAVAAKYVGGIYSTITHDSAAPGPVSWSRVPALSPPTVAARCGLLCKPLRLHLLILRIRWITLWPSKRREGSTSRCRAWTAAACTDGVVALLLRAMSACCSVFSACCSASAGAPRAHRSRGVQGPLRLA